VGSKLAVAIAVIAVVMVGMVMVVRRASDHLGRRTVGGPVDQVGVAWHDGLLSADGKRLAVRVSGRPLGGDRPCGAWYIGLVAAQLRGLRVTVITIPGPAADRPAACSSATADRCAAVTLPFPPGDRPVFDGVSGSVPRLVTAAGDGDLCSQLVAG
jgi:hypothetical protein